MKEIIINKKKYKIRDIGWEDLPNLNLFGMMRMHSSQLKVKEPYIKEQMKILGYHKPLSHKESKKIEAAITYSDEDALRLQEIEFNGIGILNPFFKAIIVSPSLEEMSITTGASIMRNPEIMEIIKETMKDILKAFQDDSKEKKHAKK